MTPFTQPARRNPQKKHFKLFIPSSTLAQCPRQLVALQ